MAAEIPQSRQSTDSVYGKPTLTLGTAKEIVNTRYCLEIDVIKELSGSVDQNFYVSSSVGAQTTEFVLKIINLKESKCEELLMGRIEIMCCLNNDNINCPVPVKLSDGNYITWYGTKESGQHAVYLQTFVHGTPFADIEITPTSDLYYSAGKYLGNVDVVLKKFHHIGFENDDSIWKPHCMNAIQELMHIIELEERKTMVECVIRMFNSKVSPHLKKLKKGVIHGDYDPNNVIVSMLPHEGEDVRPEVCGIIDFSDARYSYYVFELAICIADFLMFSKDANHSLISTRLSEGYQSKFQLNELEKSLLPICIASRLCQVAVLGTNELKVQRYNNYIDNFVSKAWNCLHSTLANLSKIIEL